MVDSKNLDFLVNDKGILDVETEGVDQMALGSLDLIEQAAASAGYVFHQDGISAAQPNFEIRFEWVPIEIGLRFRRRSGQLLRPQQFHLWHNRPT